MFYQIVVSIYNSLLTRRQYQLTGVNGTQRKAIYDIIFSTGKKKIGSRNVKERKRVSDDGESNMMTS